MEKYNYKEAVLNDVYEAITDRYSHDDIVYNLSHNRDRFISDLHDDLFLDDSVTGNASGSYTFNSWKAEEYLCHNLDLLKDALIYFCDTDYDVLESAESCDVSIRCYLLDECIEEVIEQFEEEIEEGEENE